MFSLGFLDLTLISLLVQERCDIKWDLDKDYHRGGHLAKVAYFLYRLIAMTNVTLYIINV